MDGFFVVNVVRTKQNVVVPAKWIYRIEEQLEKFINNALNANQPHLCFWTTNPDAFIGGIPNGKFKPNFQVNVNQNSSEGCFEVKIVKYKGK